MNRDQEWHPFNPDDHSTPQWHIVCAGDVW